MSQYTINVYDPYGNLIWVVPNDAIVKLSYTLQANAVGSMTLVTTAEALDDIRVTYDSRFEVLRKPDDAPWQRDGETVWLLIKSTLGRSRDGGRYRRLECVSATHLLSRRIVLYVADSAFAQKTDNADDMMKTLVRENLGSLATVPARSWATTISVQVDAGAAPSLTKAFAYRNVLRTIQEIAADAATAGTLLYFDLAAVTSTTLEFRTYIGHRGTDRTSALSQTVVSIARGNLGGTVEVADDWTDAASVVTAGGRGEGGGRNAITSSDLTMRNASTWGWREVFVDARNTQTASEIATEAAAELHRLRQKRILIGDLLSVPGSVYGVDWAWGDRVIAEHEGQSFEANVDTVTVTVEEGHEKIVAALTGAPS